MIIMVMIMMKKKKRYWYENGNGNGVVWLKMKPHSSTYNRMYRRIVVECKQCNVCVFKYTGAVCAQWENKDVWAYVYGHVINCMQIECENGHKHKIKLFEKQ